MQEVQPKRVRLFGVELDPVSEAEAITRMRDWILAASDRVRYVVTPNVQHALMLQESEEFRAAYSEAGLAVVDGAPLVWTARLFGLPVPERVAGSDLIPKLFARGGSAERPLTVFLLGAAPGVAERAAEVVERRFPHVRVVGTYSPPLGFERDPAENRAILERIAGVAPDVLVVAFGAPKQELWVYRHRNELKAKVALCGGATIDFLAGEKRRAPVWMQRVGLEWAHRVLTEPRRLARRYAVDGVRYPLLVFREWRTRRTER
jgi:N-acetylglucosaminyldiphosphoundecaprenol N-acetyl-beta-D-mannosaminyltransferase